MPQGKQLFARSTPQWLAAMVIPPVAYLSATLLLYHTGWSTGAQSSLGNLRERPVLWLSHFLPLSVLMAILGYLLPKKRSSINWAFFLIIAVLVYFNYAGLVS
jgi:hypothetical protein